MDIIANFYKDSYGRKLKRIAENRLYVDEKAFYTIKEMKNNIRNVLSVISVNFESVYKPYTAKTQYKRWAQKNYKVFKFKRWYFAFDMIKINEDNRQYVNIVDVIYEAEYTNDKFDEFLYDKQNYNLYQKKVLYESIMRDVAKIVKKAIIEYDK